MTVLLIGLAGGLGAAARFLVDTAVTSRGRGTRLPIGTILINVSGSLLLGAITAAAVERGMTESWELVLGVGFCGGYTTFSTAMVETVRLAHGGDVRGSAVNVLGTTIVTVAAAAAGYALVSSWPT